MASQKGKRKNRSSDISNPSNNSSCRLAATPKENKRQRSSSTSAKQQTLTSLIRGESMAADGRGNTTFTTGDGDGVSGVKEQLTNFEHRLCSTIEAVQTKIKATESNLSAHISDQFERLRSEIFTIQQEYDALREKLGDTEDQVEDLQDEVARLKKLLATEREERNNLEQYQRRESVRFLGVGPDRGQESLAVCEEKILSVINDKLGLEHIQAADISIAHRVGAIRGERVRPIIVKFVTRKHKTEVIQKRRLLKGSGIGIVEDLTPLNMSRLAKVKIHPSVKSCWTRDGKIFALLKNDKKVHVQNGDLEIITKATHDNTVPDIEMSAVFHSPGHRPHSQLPQHPGTGHASSTPKQPRQQQVPDRDSHRSQNSLLFPTRTAQPGNRGRPPVRESRPRRTHASDSRPSPTPERQLTRTVSAVPEDQQQNSHSDEVQDCLVSTQL